MSTIKEIRSRLQKTIKGGAHLVMVPVKVSLRRGHLSWNLGKNVPFN